MLRVFVTRRSSSWLWSLAMVGLLMLLSSCGDSTPSAKPATWTNYQGKAFVMRWHHVSLLSVELRLPLRTGGR